LKKFEDTKMVIRNHSARKDRQYNGQKKKYTETNTLIVDKTIQRKLEIEQHEPTTEQG